MSMSSRLCPNFMSLENIDDNRVGIFIGRSRVEHSDVKLILVGITSS